jgi:hypothetical protein
MPNILNPAQRVIENIRTAPATMRLVDEVLGDQRLEQFAWGVSRILVHADPSSEDGLCSVIGSKDTQLEVCIQLFNAGTELQTGWNSIRLANIPASQRQGRVACESVAVAAIFSLPTSSLLGSLPKKDPLAKCLRSHPDKTAIDCYKPAPTGDDDPRCMQPVVRATQFFNSFLSVAELELEIRKEVIDSVKLYRKVVQHPASHGSAELGSYHFETIIGGAAGAVFDRKRADSYLQAAHGLTAITHLLADILDRVTNYVADS